MIKEISSIIQKEEYKKVYSNLFYSENIVGNVDER
jgi:hypothetical protein